jgi:biotin operon repressor
MTDILPFLTRRPQTKRELAERMGVPSREVEARIQQARLDGKAILSNGDGYWMTDDPTEVAAMAARLHRRASTIHDTATALAATAEKLAKREDPTLWGGRP